MQAALDPPQPIEQSIVVANDNNLVANDNDNFVTVADEAPVRLAA